ncbi:hypothetical protein SAMN05216410_2792 [Sanguibacter gelidistatuariae]|uniref:Calcineurin-like phosphoesterase n=1 Tax=Sanguibacter gelidistatuariae TaxID=1814289 RepID=A0A1G6RXT8_9MICO|nr:hypothetical protein [Sanguibacter gelidistatuariae]SDD08755.1 hypothetical protein SAMN05216410_2792 [Sanguibacter gelidistatuariae]
MRAFGVRLWAGLRALWTRLGGLPVPPRWVRYTLVGLVVVLACAVYGVTTASVRASLGPHNATYEVTTNSVITVDLGPLGTVQLESPLPASLGATVRIEEIPDDLTSVDSATTLNALASDVQSYLQFFSGPSATISYIAKALIQDAGRRAGAALGVVVLISAVGYLALGSARRRELGVPLARGTWAITAGVAIVALVGGTVVTNRATTSLYEVGAQASSVFDGTALEGARITGRLSGVIETYGGQLVGVYRDNENFYAGANSKLTEAWQLRAEEDLAAADLLVENAASDSPERAGSGDDSAATDGSAATTDPGEQGSTTDDTASPSEDESSQEKAAEIDEKDIVTLLMVSDLHCNTGMSPLIKNLATLSGAKVVLNGGDSTINGTAVERFCVDSFAGAVPKGATMVQSDGNHDSSITSGQARDAGVTVLDGKVVEVEGIRILGDSDPNETRIGQGSTSVTGETYTQAGERLRDVACEAKDPVDLLLIHTPAVGDPVLASGCVPIQLSGHKHVRIGPQVVGQGIRYVSSTTAGAVEGAATIGPLNGVAQMTVFRFDTERRVMLDYRVVAVYPDGSVEVGAPMTFPLVPTVVESLTGQAPETVTDTPADTPVDTDTPSTDPAGP